MSTLKKGPFHFIHLMLILTSEDILPRLLMEKSELLSGFVEELGRWIEKKMSYSGVCHLKDDKVAIC